MDPIRATDGKEALRKEFLRRRAAVPPEERQQKSLAASERVLGLDTYRAARAILAYRPIGAELDPGPIIAHAVSSGRLVYYPRVVDAGLEFAATVDPHPGRGSPAAGAALESTVVLVPGVAFDHRGVRLGRGGGHYDRALAQLRHGVRVGLAFEIQLAPELPRDPWDVLMDCIVTEARVLCIDDTGCVSRQDRP
mgnify:CR=1 FL=1